MIDTSCWEEFSMNKLFDICAGKYHSAEEYESGTTPYISASAENNGIAQRINLKPEFKGNVIITGKIGCTAFYQVEDFCATSDVNVFRAKNFEMDSGIGLFITSVLNFSENYKWSYGRQCRVGSSKKIYIKLPVKLDNNSNPKIDDKQIYSEKGYIPDFQYMKDFIKYLENKERENKHSIKNLLITKNKKYNKNLNIKKWKEFNLSEIFEKFEKCKCNNASRLLEKGNDIEYIGAKKNENGFKEYVKRVDNLVTKGNCIVFICDGEGSVGYTNYIDKDFIGSTTLTVGYNSKLNANIGMFLVTLLDQNRYKYSYGRKYKKDFIKETIIKLPAKKDGSPDYEFMESYIKQLPYGDRI